MGAGKFLTFFLIVPLACCTETTTTHHQLTKNNGIFSPRMDYDQWRPLGQGDPLKHDPTFDYVPPTLDRVHYWLEPGNGTKKKKTEVLLLGISSRKSSLDLTTPATGGNQENFLKFIDGPKLGSQRILVRPPNQYHHHHHHHHHHYAPVPVQYLPSPFFPPSNSRKKFAMPYTMLLPPPVATITPQNTTSTTKVTIQPSNLVYHSSESTPSASSGFYPQHLQPPEPLVQLQFSPAPSQPSTLLGSNSDQNINYVTAPSLSMHKGSVSDVDLGPANQYVKFGKPEGQPALMVLLSKSDLLKPPPAPQPFKKNPLVTALIQEKIPTTTLHDNLITTTVPPLTTDPLFKHYKQPLDPIKGPLYLIIQGHSKVKTYSPAKSTLSDGIPIQETNEIGTGDETEPYGEREGKSVKDTLKHVIQKGLGRIPEVQETELRAGYKVGPTTYNEKKEYRKGTVETVH